jgi:thioesterase domain-containing protein
MFRPNGPYVIAGYCAGGTIAYELAQQLIREGTTVHFVALFAGAFPKCYRVLPQLHERLALRARRTGKHLRTLGMQTFNDARRYITERLARINESRAAAPDPVLALRARLKEVTAAAVSRYVPRELNGRVCLFLPSRTSLLSGDRMQAWRGVTPNIEE